jgi:hypothetical protein
MSTENAASEWAAPIAGQRMAIKCRGHWHVGIVHDGPSWDDDEQGLTYWEVNGFAMTNERAVAWVLPSPGAVAS